MDFRLRTPSIYSLHLSISCASLLDSPSDLSYGAPGPFFLDRPPDFFIH